MTDKINQARAAILADLKARRQAGDKSVAPCSQDDIYRWHHPQDNYFIGHGKMPCPVCKQGTLHYSREGYNGHVHAQCTTDNCIWWRE